MKTTILLCAIALLTGCGEPTATTVATLTPKDLAATEPLYKPGEITQLVHNCEATAAQLGYIVASKRGTGDDLNYIIGCMTSNRTADVTAWINTH